MHAHMFVKLKLIALRFLIFSSNGHPSPVNYNPADHFILTLAIVPGKEKDCKAKVKVTTV